MARVTDFSVGRRWRSKVPGRHGPGVHIEFVIVGKGKKFGDPTQENPAEKSCKIIADDHNHSRFCACAHGTEGQYSHDHLRKYAVLLPLDAPEQNAVKKA